MIVFANWKKLKNIFKIHRRQKENHRQEKKLKFEKIFEKFTAQTALF
jgi:hypothetical protein